MSTVDHWSEALGHLELAAAHLLAAGDMPADEKDSDAYDSMVDALCRLQPDDGREEIEIRLAELGADLAEESEAP